MKSLLQERKLECEECRRPWLHTDERWLAFWIDDGSDEKLIFYCPACAEREFAAE